MTGERVEMRLHHVGFVVADIPTAAAGFASSLNTRWDTKIFHDPLQKVRVSFLDGWCSSDAQIELVEPAAEDSPVLNVLKKGGGLHHLCYEVADLQAQLDRMQQKGARLVKPPLPAVAFENRRIAWIFTREKLLVELLECTA